MKPNRIDTIQTIQAGLPTVAAIAPIENSTRAGTPLATQNAPRQSILRCRLPTELAACGTASNVVASILVFPCLKKAGPCRSEPARDGHPGTADSQAPRVIVDVHREQARSYRCVWAVKKLINYAPGSCPGRRKSLL
ncbi:hypothetical protein D3C80_1676420 [compost metagenome]